MASLWAKIWPFGRSGADPASSPAMRALVSNLHYEIVPMKSIEQAIEDLPPDAHVSVTCSPAKGIAATQDYTLRLLDLGHHAVPHFAARLVEGPDHAVKLAGWLREHGIESLFVIAGDAPEPVGPYEGALPFIRDLLDADPAERVAQSRRLAAIVPAVLGRLPDWWLLPHFHSVTVPGLAPMLEQHLVRPARHRVRGQVLRREADAVGIGQQQGTLVQVRRGDGHIAAVVRGERDALKVLYPLLREELLDDKLRVRLLAVGQDVVQADEPGRVRPAAHLRVRHPRRHPLR